MKTRPTYSLSETTIGMLHLLRQSRYPCRKCRDLLGSHSIQHYEHRWKHGLIRTLVECASTRILGQQKPTCNERRGVYDGPAHLLRSRSLPANDSARATSACARTH